MYEKEIISEQVSKVKTELKEVSRRLTYWQSICRHDFECNTYFCGGSEYEVEKTCKVCGLVEWDT